jgi:hypothetical protein
MTPVIPLTGGAVCFDALDCVSWGNYAGTPPSATGTPAPALISGKALIRNLKGNGTLEPGDDSVPENSFADFALGAPAPRNNARVVGETRKVLDYTFAAKEKGMSVIFITHNIRQVHEVADRFTIIERGRKMGDFYKDDVSEQEVANMITSGELPERLRLFNAEDDEAQQKGED